MYSEAFFSVSPDHLKANFSNFFNWQPVSHDTQKRNLERSFWQKLFSACFQVKNTGEKKLRSDMGNESLVFQSLHRNVFKRKKKNCMRDSNLLPCSSYTLTCTHTKTYSTHIHYSSLLSLLNFSIQVEDAVQEKTSVGPNLDPTLKRRKLSKVC